MATQYSDNVVNPNPQAFGVAGPFVISQNRPIGLEARRCAWAGKISRPVPSHAIILCVIYPVLGLVLFRMVLGYSVLPLLFPLAAGFTLTWSFCRARSLRTQPPPRARRGSRRVGCHARATRTVFRRHARTRTLLLVLFIVWIAAADAIYIANLGNAPAASIPDSQRAC